MYISFPWSRYWVKIKSQKVLIALMRLEFWWEDWMHDEVADDFVFVDSTANFMKQQIFDRKWNRICSLEFNALAVNENLSFFFI